MKNNVQNVVESGAKGFMSGVLVLSLSTFVVKLIGLAFKIPMLSFLGTEGMGYFNSAYEIYALLCVVSTAGLPVALSILISSARAKGNGWEIRRTYRAARGIFFTLGAIGTLTMLAFAKGLADFIGNPSAASSIVAIAPALLFICLASAVRGYCQGFESMTPTAVSQLIEALSKLVLGILFAQMALKKGWDIPTVSACAVLGISVGTLLSMIYLGIAKRSKRYSLDSAGQKDGTDLRPVRELVRIALPITLGSAVLGLTRIIDMTLIMRRLQDIGVSVAQSNRIYGAYTTLAVPVFSLVPALITPVSMALVPRLSSSLELKDGAGERTVIENSMRLTTLFAIPASLGMSAFARPILELLFNGQTEAISISAPLLSILGVSVVFSCLITTTNAILQAYRRVYLPIVSMSVGVAVKLISTYLLIGTESVGVLGAPIGSLLCNITVTLLNLWFMSAYSGCKISVLRVFIKPLTVSAVSVGISIAIYGRVNGRYGFLIAILSAIIIYLILSLITKNITADDIALLPFGDKIIKNKYIKANGGKNDCSGKEKNASRKEEL